MLAIDRLLLIACAVTLSACTVGDPYVFAMRVNSGWPIEGHIQGDAHRVERDGPRRLIVQDGADVAMRCEMITDGSFNTEFTLSANSHVTFFLRTTPYDRATQRDDGIAIVVTPSLTTVTLESGETHAVPTSIEPGKPAVIDIVNDAGNIDITVACTAIGRLKTTLPSTQWVIVKPSAGSSVTLTDPTILPLYDND